MIDLYSQMRISNRRLPQLRGTHRGETRSIAFSFRINYYLNLRDSTNAGRGAWGGVGGRGWGAAGDDGLNGGAQRGG
jgi:hypothetical protein